MPDPNRPLDPLSKDTLDRMKQSAVLHLSLGSKELFHSNLIAFLCELFPVQMGEAINGLLASQGEETGGLKVSRERNHFDLDLTLGAKRVVVEVKVKSLPNEKQLKEYGEKAKGAAELWLWSLWRPAFFGDQTSWACPSEEEDSQPQEWRYFDLEDVVRHIHAHVRGVAEGYLGGLLDDWLALVEWLARARDAVVSDDAQGFLGRVKSLEVLRELRVHDLFLKALYDLLAEAIEERILDRASGGLQSISGAAGDISFWRGGMSRGTGSCSVYKVLSPRLDKRGEAVVGVQIQGDHFRLFSNVAPSDDKGSGSRLAEHLDKTKRWFRVEELVAEHGDVLKPAKMRDSLCAFEPWFFYRYAKLQPNATLEDIAALAAMVVQGVDAREAGWLP